MSCLFQVKAGSFLNVGCVLVMTLAVYTWGDAYFDFDLLPWIECNSTTTLAMWEISTRTLRHFHVQTFTKQWRLFFTKQQRLLFLKLEIVEFYTMFTVLNWLYPIGFRTYTQCRRVIWTFTVLKFVPQMS